MPSDSLSSLRLLTEVADRAVLANRAGITFGGARDLYAALGYTREIKPSQYRDRFRRGGIAKRIVSAMPKSTWRGDVELIEDPDPNVQTPFEDAFRILDDRLHVWSTLLRTDILASIGHYAILLIGANGNLAEPLERAPGPDSVFYLQPYGEEDAPIDAFEANESSPRFGMPVRYKLRKYGSTAMAGGKFVHWTRVIHVADECVENGVYGTPVLEAVWNDLDNLDKVIGGGSEAYWKRVHQGMALNIDPEMKVDAEAMKDLQAQIDEYEHKQRRIFRLRGTEVEMFGSDVADISKPMDAIITLISATTGIPKRILLGSERGELASSQDKMNWDERIFDRRRDFAEPHVVRQLVDRLIALGTIPTPAQYDIRWPEIEKSTMTERAEVADLTAGLNAKSGGLVITPSEIRENYLGLEPLTDDQVKDFEDEKARKAAMQQSLFGSADASDADTLDKETPINDEEDGT